jgi:hypothetical protein
VSKNGHVRVPRPKREIVNGVSNKSVKFVGAILRMAFECLPFVRVANI